jgi:hypothetical protein
MSAILAFALGWVFKALFSATLGQVLFDPLAKLLVKEVAQIPRVIHYLDRHPGKSWLCHECKLGHAERHLDSIS